MLAALILFGKYGHLQQNYKQFLGIYKGNVSSKYKPERRSRLLGHVGDMSMVAICPMNSGSRERSKVISSVYNFPLYTTQLMV